MNQIITWISAHPFWTFGAYVLVMLFTQSLPKPTATSSRFYLWFYTFMHLISANVGLVTKMLKVPLPTLTETTTATVAQAPDGSVTQTVEKQTTTGATKQ